METFFCVLLSRTPEHCPRITGTPCMCFTRNSTNNFSSVHRWNKIIIPFSTVLCQSVLLRILILGGITAFLVRPFSSDCTVFFEGGPVVSQSKTAVGLFVVDLRLSQRCYFGFRSWRYAAMSLGGLVPTLRMREVLPYSSVTQSSNNSHGFGCYFCTVCLSSHRSEGLHYWDLAINGDLAFTSPLKNRP